jgi:hypothetical protein
MIRFIFTVIVLAIAYGSMKGGDRTPIAASTAASAPKYTPPSLPASTTELPPSVMPEILKRLARAEQDSKPKLDTRGKQIFDFSPIPMNPQANSKTDILGFYISMPRAEVDAQFEELGCKPKQDKVSATYTKLECKFAQGEELRMGLVKGLVSGQETEVVKSVDLVFNSNDGALHMIDAVSRQFRALPVFFSDDLQTRRIRYCAAGKRPEYACSQGELARWPLTNQVKLTLDLSLEADDERKKPDQYWLQMNFEPLEDLEAEKAYKNHIAQKRNSIPAPRF